MIQIVTDLQLEKKF